jgi:hypothetical protein
MSDDDDVEVGVTEIWEEIEGHSLSNADQDPEVTLAFYDGLIEKLKIARDAIAEEHGLE